MDISYAELTVPIYDYRCKACDEVAEHVLLGFDADAPKECPECGSGPLVRAYAGARVQMNLNSWGFSRTDSLIQGDTRGKSFKALRERASRIVEE